jgi:hypothetical protein
MGCNSNARGETRDQVRTRSSMTCRAIRDAITTERPFRVRAQPPSSPATMPHALPNAPQRAGALQRKVAMRTLVRPGRLSVRLSLAKTPAANGANRDAHARR